MQTVGLAQATVEDRGIPTASITMLADITAKISPPRALSVPYPLGFPLGEANNVELQTEILMQLLALLVRNDVPVLEGLRN
jgi:D-proline reductase (dithiol) PrdB